MLSAEELHDRGRAASSAGRHLTARRFFLRARERAREDDTLALIESSLAYVESEIGDARQGLLLIDSALGRPLLSARMEGIVRGQEALIHMRAGNSTRALVAFESAIDRLQQSGPHLGRAQLNRGNVYLQLGDHEKAIADFEGAVREFRAADMPVQRAKAQHNLGYTYMLAGDLIRALHAMDESRPVLAPLSPVSEALGDQDRAEVLVAAGLTTEAEAALTNAVKAFGARRLRQWQAEAELVLARMLVISEPARARTFALRAGRRFRGRGSEGWALRTDAIALTSRIETGSRSGAVADEAEELAGRLRQNGLRHDAAALQLQAARVLVRGGATQRARDLLTRYKPDIQTPLSTRILAREVRAELAAREGRRTNALRHIRQGLDGLHEWQSAFGSLDLQSSLVGQGRRLAFQGIGLALDDGRPDMVFEWSERARALVSRVTSVRPPSNPAAAADLAELRKLRARADGVSPSTDLVRREAYLRTQIRQRAWYDKGSQAVNEPHSLEAVMGELAASGAALVAYLYLDDRLHALVADGSRAEVRELGRYGPVRSLLDGMQADLDVAASSLPRAMHDTVRAGLQNRLTLLAGLLVDPIVDLLGSERVVITPTGALAGTPWTMLPGLSASTVTVPPSASTWASDRTSDLVLDSSGFAAGPHVDRAEEEVAKGASTWSCAQVVVGDQATAANLRELAESVDVLHISAHGRHSADNPLFSGLELSDGPWFGYDIDQLERIPQVIVLSACELGRSSVRWGEESIGMTAAWLHAGARCVIAAPASVNDDVACDLLSAAHHLMASGVAPAEALSKAATFTTDGLGSPFICFGTGW